MCGGAWIIAVSLMLDAAVAAGQRAKLDTISARSLAPGVTYRQLVDRSGPFIANVVRVDLRRGDIGIRALRARDQLRGREKTSEMARRLSREGTTVLAAVNADFFNLTTGENENNQVIGGEWWKGLKVTDSPYDTYDNVHAQLAFDVAGRPHIERFRLDARAWTSPATNATPIITVNANPSGNPEGTALYTSRFGATTPRDTARQTAEAALAAVGRRGDTLIFVRRGAVSAASGSTIPPDGAVLAAYGPGLRLDEVRKMVEGDTVSVLLETLPRLAREGDNASVVPATLVGGWPQIVRDGRAVASEAPTVEGTISRNAEVRHPRTAVGFTRDGATLLLVTVDGRSEQSVGMTLAELAALMRRLGAWQAMNFDGGGSTTMVIRDTLVNHPTDATGEREVGNALAVVIRKR